MLESELFGYEKGAFTGAGQRKLGRVELAHRGTLFLDEIGELAPALQAKVLRVLETREFERLGGTATIRADVRLVAATNRDLKREVAERRFREDLFFRLSVMPITVPPLRERGDDVLLLAHHFVERQAQASGRTPPTLDDEARAALCAYHWPGNVRELQNCLERAAILADGDVIRARHLHLRDTAVPAAPGRASGGRVRSAGLACRRGRARGRRRGTPQDRRSSERGGQRSGARGRPARAAVP